MKVDWGGRVVFNGGSEANMDETADWYLADGGRTLGRFTKAQVLEQLQSGKITKTTMAFRHGTTPAWTPVGQVGEFAGPAAPAEAPVEGPKLVAPPAPIRERGSAVPTVMAPAPAAAPAPSAVPAPSAAVAAKPAGAVAGRAERVEHQIVGGEIQYLEIDLESGGAVFGDPGSVISCEADVRIEGGSGAGGVPLALFAHKGSGGRRRVVFGGLVAGAVVAVELKTVGGVLWCRPDGLMAHERGVSAPGGLKTVPGSGQGERLVLHRMEGDGCCFLQAGGRAIRHRLDGGQTLRAEAACLLACEEGVEIDVEPSGGEGVRLAVLKGPGVVWLQTQSAAKLAGRMRAARGQ